MPTSGPRAPLPPVIVSTEEGTWAHDTMSRRVRTDILARVFRENTFHANALNNLKQLDIELSAPATTALTKIIEDGGPDVKTWNETILKKELANGDTWLSAPWIVAEFYLYRRIMSAINYFSDPVDPFQMQKELGLSSAISSITTLASRVNNAVENRSQQSLDADLKGFILTSLWGNRMDLSLWPVGGDEGGKRRTDAFASVIESGQRMVLSNNVDDVVEHICETATIPPRIDIIVDNAGFELFCDLCLADFLVSAQLSSVVHIQLKAHPTFVSDAMKKDVLTTIEFLRGGDSEIAQLGTRWASHVESGRWKLVEKYFWVQPTPMWEMPQETAMDLVNSAIVFVKGDANYRRLLGDRHWPLDTPFRDVVCYFPAPVCALRTLKAELGCGMKVEDTQRASSEDERWLVAGKYGVVQFLNTRLF